MRCVYPQGLHVRLRQLRFRSLISSMSHSHLSLSFSEARSLTAFSDNGGQLKCWRLPGGVVQGRVPCVTAYAECGGGVQGVALGGERDGDRHGDRDGDRDSGCCGYSRSAHWKHD